MGMVACDDKLPVAPPQANEQGPVLEGFAGATATLSVTNVDLPTTVADDAVQYLNMYTVSSGTSGLPQSDIFGELEISNTSTFAESIILPAYEGMVGTVDLNSLCEAHTQLFGISPEAKTVYYRVLMYANVGGNTYRLDGYDSYGASGTYSETYDPGFVMEDNYYIIGIESWDPGSEVAMSHAEGVSPYDDPNFTYSFTCDGMVYWKLVTPDVHAEVGQPGFDANTSFWPFLYRGVPEDGDNLNGTLIQEDGDAPSIPAGEWTITVNMKDFTYTVTGTPAVAAGAPSGIYLRGGFNDWGNPASSEFIATETEGIYVIPFITMTAGEFKVASADWSTVDFGSNGGAFVVGTEYELGKDGNINLTADFTGYAVLTKSTDSYSLLLQPYASETAGTSTGIYLRGGMNDWGADAAYEFQTSAYKDVYVLSNQSINAGVEFKIADASWGAINFGGTPNVDLTKQTCIGLVYNADNISLASAFTGNLRFINLLGANYLQFVTE